MTLNHEPWCLYRQSTDAGVSADEKWDCDCGAYQFRLENPAGPPPANPERLSNGCMIYRQGR